MYALIDVSFDVIWLYKFILNWYKYSLYPLLTRLNVSIIQCVTIVLNINKEININFWYRININIDV